MGESIHDAHGAADDLLAFVDELPSLFADEEEQQLLMLDDDSAPHAELTQQPLLLASAHRDDDGLRLAPAPSLSAEEISALLRDIDGGAVVDEIGVIGPVQHQQLEPQPRALVPKQHPGANVQLNRKKSKGTTHKSNKARDGRKTEILLLRKAVFELESRLDVLKKQTNAESQELSNYYDSGYNNRRQASRLLLAHSNNGRDPDAELQDAWREIARRQFDQRDASERENIRLRLVLESQLKVARSLEKFLMLKAASTMVRHVTATTIHYRSKLY